MEASRALVQKQVVIGLNSVVRRNFVVASAHRPIFGAPKWRREATIVELATELESVHTRQIRVTAAP